MRYLLAFLMVFVPAALSAEERATLRGRFVYDGAPPPPVELKVDKDQAACSKKLFDESLVIDAQDRGIANIVVELYVGRDERPPVHPRLEELCKTPTNITIANCRFEPHMRWVLTGQVLTLTNEDPIAHNRKIDVQRNPPWSNIPPGGQHPIRKRFKQPERTPCSISCAIHPWMLGYLVIRDHPYVAITDEHGRFEITDLPPGEWTFRAWHERAVVREVTLATGAAEWRRGRFQVTLPADGVDLGDIHVAPKLLKEK